eukprot:287497-Rhodomonas_salina.1
MPRRTIIDVTQISSFQEWILTAVRMVWKNTYYSCCPVPYPVVMVELELDRATMTYLGGMVAPPSSSHADEHPPLLRGVWSSRHIPLNELSFPTPPNKQNKQKKLMVLSGPVWPQ